MGDRVRRQHELEGRGWEQAAGEDDGEEEEGGWGGSLGTSGGS